MLWRSQHCPDPPNIVSALPTLVGRQIHCWELPNIVPGLATLLEPLSHCWEDRAHSCRRFPIVEGLDTDLSADFTLQKPSRSWKRRRETVSPAKTSSPS